MSNIQPVEEQKRELAAKVVDRILSDASFRNALKDNPDGAMDAAFNGEWTHLLTAINDPEVSGYLAGQEIASDSNCCQGGTCVESY